MNESLERQFHEQMRRVYREAAEFGYRPTYFLRMVEEQGGVLAAKNLLRKGITDGLERLTREGRLDISMEALVLKEPWSQLFTDEENGLAKWALENVGKVGK
jgi:hypothetical protein